MSITRALAEELIRREWPDLRLEGTKPLGRGRYGVVWRVTDGEDVEAIKVMALQARSRIRAGRAEDARELLGREWKRVTGEGARLGNEWIVGVNDWRLVEDEDTGADEANAYGLVRMALWPSNLHDHVVNGFQERNGAAMARLITAVAAALDGIWQASGYICTDLKPENLLVRQRTDGSVHVVIGDIGGLKGLDSLSGSTQTTPRYSAPETLRGDKTDLLATIFGFGLVAFFVIEGRLPHEDDELDLSTMRRFLRERGPDFRPDLPAELAPVVATIRHCLKEDRAQRPQSFGEVIEELIGATRTKRKEREDGETMVRRPAAAGAARLWTPGQVFRDAPEAPEMVVVPAGRFPMGSPGRENGRDSDESPQHQVTVARPFAVGKYEVTFDEWDACVAAGGCNVYPPDDAGWGRGRRPVINVSWDDAQAYVQWLSRRTGQRYRLLTEAEWEYACRAGTTTPFHFGATISTEQANYDGNYTYGSGQKGEYRRKTVPVGSFPANGFGLHDMHGNVGEWVEDIWHDGYEGAPAEGSPWTAGGDQDRRVVRGGSWKDLPWFLRAAQRRGHNTSGRLDFVGFRVARTL